MSGSHLIQSLRRKQKTHRKYNRIPFAKKWGKKEKRQHNTSGIGGQVWDEGKDKHIDSNNSVKNIIMG